MASSIDTHVYMFIGLFINGLRVIDIGIYNSSEGQVQMRGDIVVAAHPFHIPRPQILYVFVMLLYSTRSYTRCHSAINIFMLMPSQKISWKSPIMENPLIMIFTTSEHPKAVSSISRDNLRISIYLTDI